MGWGCLNGGLKMRCPFCGHNEDKVVDSRESNEFDTIRRRRECLKCAKRFTTYERTEEIPLMVVKKDGRREPFDRKKILAGLMKACEKRPVALEQVESLVDEIERELLRQDQKEINSRRVGEIIMAKLPAIDEVAYVRFASVYREFQDINQFMQTLKQMLSKQE
jgi:transcriptional repressor NrdR